MIMSSVIPSKRGIPETIVDPATNLSESTGVGREKTVSSPSTTAATASPFSIVQGSTIEKCF